MNVIVDGLMTNYQKSGTGKVLLMIHGWGDSVETFQALADQLGDSYQIVALDLPGFGGTQAPSELWGTAAFAAFVSRFIDKLGLKPYAVVGHSFGGAVAIELASHRPAFKKLVLLASAGVRDKRTVQAGLLKAAAKAAKPALLAMPKHRRERFKRKVYSSIGSDALLLPHMERIYRKIVAEDMRPTAETIGLQTLLIYGSRDMSTPPADGLALHKAISGSDLRVIEADHFLHQTAADQIAELMDRFLKGGHA
jgi:pimeloyl-ACP methyl ester carboxylesterase